MNKIIKLSETHYIIVDDSEINVGDWVFNHIAPFFNPYQVVSNEQLQLIKNALTLQYGGIQKITHSNQPLGFLRESGSTTANLKHDWTNVKPLSLSEVEELIYGCSVDMIAQKEFPNWYTDYEQGVLHQSYIKGFNAHKQLVKDKFILTRKQIEELIKKSREVKPFYYEEEGEEPVHISNFAKYSENEIIQSLLPKTEWNCRIINDKIELI